jgi:hypothetical protein
MRLTERLTANLDSIDRRFLRYGVFAPAVNDFA